MCKAQQSYLPYLTAAGSGVLPLNITIQPCAGYMLAYNAATRDTPHLLPACPITEPTLFDVSHCPIFKLIPVFVSNKDFVVLDFASLPKVDAVQHRGVGGSSASSSTPIMENFQKRNGIDSTTAALQKVDEVTKSYGSTGVTANRPPVDGFPRRHTSSGTKGATNTDISTVDNVQHASHKYKSMAMDKSPNSIVARTKTRPVLKEIEILSAQNSDKWVQSPTTMLSAMSPSTTTNERSLDSSIVSVIAPKTPKKITYSPRTLRNIGRGMTSPGWEMRR